MSVLIVGSIALDHIKTPSSDHPDLLGGSASYASVAASFFASVRMSGIVGEDFPQAHWELLEKRGIDLAGVERAVGKTFAWHGEYEQNMNNRRTLSVELNVFEHFKPSLPAEWKKSPIVLLANIAPSLQLHVLDQLQSPDFVIADTMDLWIEIAQADLRQLMKRVDLLILNDSEARQLTLQDNVVKAGRALLEMGPRYVVVKKGEHGAQLFGRDLFFSLPAYPLESVLDPTGAGDCFAGALAGYLAQRGGVPDAGSLKEALLRGTVVASFNVEEFSLRRIAPLQEAEIEARCAFLREATRLA